MQFQIETVTPDMARSLLSTNDANRNMAKHIVLRYSRQMSNGEWKLNGEAIKISEDGILLDGQHRLAAIEKAGVDVPMLVVRGLPRETIKTLDTGKTRSTADHLSIHGFKGNVNVLAAAITIVKEFSTGKYVKIWVKITPTEAINFLNTNRDIFHSMDRIPPRGSKLVPASIAVGFHFLFSKIDPVKADVFFAQLFSGANLQTDSPVLALRNRLTLSLSENKRGQSFRKQYCYYVVRAFKAFLSGEPLTTLRYYPDAEIELPTKGE